MIAVPNVRPMTEQASSRVRPSARGFMFSTMKFAFLGDRKLHRRFLSRCTGAEWENSGMGFDVRERTFLLKAWRACCCSTSLLILEHLKVREIEQKDDSFAVQSVRLRVSADDCQDLLSQRGSEDRQIFAHSELHASPWQECVQERALRWRCNAEFCVRLLD